MCLLAMTILVVSVMLVLYLPYNLCVLFLIIPSERPRVKRILRNLRGTGDDHRDREAALYHHGLRNRRRPDDASGERLGEGDGELQIESFVKTDRAVARDVKVRAVADQVLNEDHPMPNDEIGFN